MFPSRSRTTQNVLTKIFKREKLHVIIKKAVNQGRWDVLKAFLSYVKTNNEDATFIALFWTKRYLSNQPYPFSEDAKRGIKSAINAVQYTLDDNIRVANAIKALVSGPMDVIGLPDLAINSVITSMIRPVETSTIETAKEDFDAIRQFAMSGSVARDVVNRHRTQLENIYAQLVARFACVYSFLVFNPEHPEDLPLVINPICKFFMLPRHVDIYLVSYITREAIYQLLSFLGQFAFTPNVHVAHVYQVYRNLVNDAYGRFCIQKWYAERRDAYISHQRTITAAHPRVTRQHLTDEREKLEWLLATPAVFDLNRLI